MDAFPTNPSDGSRLLTEKERRMIAELRGAPRVEVIKCAFCEAECADNLEAAVQRGWTRIQNDDGMEWIYLGLCPNCERQGQGQGSV